MLHCKLVDCINFRLLLGRNLCLQMKIISYLDNDQINRPATGSLPVYTLDITTAKTKEQLIKQYPRVFGPGIGLLEGKYHIFIDDTYKPVQYASRRVPVAIRDKLKQILEHLA